MGIAWGQIFCFICGMKKSNETVKVKRLNMDFKTPEELDLLRQLKIMAATLDLPLRELVILQLSQGVKSWHDKKK